MLGFDIHSTHTESWADSSKANPGSTCLWGSHPGRDGVGWGGLWPMWAGPTGRQLSEFKDNYKGGQDRTDSMPCLLIIQRDPENHSQDFHHFQQSIYPVFANAYLMLYPHDMKDSSQTPSCS
jgi:hypothetical protein